MKATLQWSLNNQDITVDEKLIGDVRKKIQPLLKITFFKGWKIEEHTEHVYGVLDKIRETRYEKELYTLLKGDDKVTISFAFEFENVVSSSQNHDPEQKYFQVLAKSISPKRRYRISIEISNEDETGLTDDPNPKSIINLLKRDKEFDKVLGKIKL